MSLIEQLATQIREALPGVRLHLDRGEGSGRADWLDAELDGHAVTVEWRPGAGFGVSTTTEGYGEGPDEVYLDLQDVVDRVVRLLEGREMTRPPREVLLRRLREARRMTQQELAASLGVRQPTVSKMERRDDMYLSTLRSLISAMGGRLELRAVFPDEVVKIGIPGDAGDSEDLAR